MSSSIVPLRLATEPVVCATLEDFARAGARRALQQAIEDVVAEYVDAHAGLMDQAGHRMVGRNGEFKGDAENSKADAYIFRGHPNPT